MKNFSLFKKLFILAALFPYLLSAQSFKPVPVYQYFFTEEPTSVCLSESLRLKIKNEIKANLAILEAAGILPTVNLRKITTDSFIWPLQASNILVDPGYYIISGFADHNPSYPDQLLDYNSGTRTYDRESGYNHRGTDICPWPFGWYKMDNYQVEIISMAPGTIILKQDGNYDRSCQMSNDPWNAVFVLHDNGATAWYGHMKNGSLTTKEVGERVDTGEFLGIVGSSGSSTGPHLHLEIYDSENKLIDPWEGPSNLSITSSWWSNQPPYYDSKILKVSSHSTWPVFPECPEQEILNLKDEYTTGDTVFVVSYYRDLLKGQIANHKLTTPEGLNYWSWDYSIPNSNDYLNHYAASWWGWWFTLPANPSPGIWEYSIFFENVLYRHYFTVNSSQTSTESLDRSPDSFYLSDNYPNPFNPTTIINYTIPGEHDLISSRRVNLSIYDILGNKIITLVDEDKSPGQYKVEFNAEHLTSGIYFYTLTCGKLRDTKKMVVVR